MSLDLTLSRKQVLALIEAYIADISESEQMQLAKVLFSRNESIDPIPALCAVCRQVERQHVLPVSVLRDDLFPTKRRSK